MGGTCSTHRRNEKYVQYFCRKPEVKRALGRPRRVWDFISTDLREIGREIWTGCIWPKVGTIGAIL
jgi:hypothetical protein